MLNDALLSHNVCFVQVRGGDDPLDIPIYTMCRRWVRNDPYNDEAHVAEPHVGLSICTHMCVYMCSQTPSYIHMHVLMSSCWPMICLHNMLDLAAVHCSHPYEQHV